MLALSGCVGSQADAGALEQPQGPILSQDEGTFDESTGAIVGSVLTTELLPAGNATVGLLEDESVVRATPEGRFAFSRLAPGDYTVQASALGYQANVRKVAVAAGQATEVEFLLEPAAAEGPFHETEIHKGLVRSVTWRVGDKCDTVVQPPIGTCLGLQMDDVTFHYASEPDWATYVDEVQWVPNSAVGHQRAYVFATFPNVTDFSGVPDFKSPGHFEAAGTSPVTLRIERETARARGIAEDSQYGRTRFRAVNNFDDVNATVFAVSLMIDQPMNVYLSIFYQQPAPVTFTALPDA